MDLFLRDPVLFVAIVSLSMAGLAYNRARMAEIAKDMEVIESGPHSIQGN